MTYDDIIAEINERAGMRRDTEKARRALELAIDSLEGLPFAPWFLLSELSHANCTIGEQRVPIPTDFIKGYEDGELFIDDDDGNRVPLVKADYDDLMSNYANEPRGLPVAYALTGSYYRLFPKPDKEYDLHMLYYRKQSKQWTNTALRNGWLLHAPKLVIAAAAIIVMESTRDEKGLILQKKIMDEELDKLHRRHVELEEINVDRSRGLN